MGTPDSAGAGRDPGDGVRRPDTSGFDRSGIVRGADGVLRYARRPETCVEMLADSVRRTPDAEALVELDGPRLTYRQVWDNAARVAGGLQQRGVGPGDRVTIEYPNGVGWCLAFLGVLLAGAIAVPVNTRLREGERHHVVADADAAVRLTPRDPLPRGPALVYEHGQASDPATIFYTSGTTGLSKGAVITHENLMATTENSRRARQLPVGEIRDLVSVPLFHVTGCLSQLLTTLDISGTAVIMPRFEVRRFLRAIEDERVNKTTSVPAIYWLALNQDDIDDHDLSGVRWLSYGGAPCPPRLVRRIVDRFPGAEIGNGYGLTETSSVATYLPGAHAIARSETVGFAVPVVELDLDGVDVATGVGELLVRGQNVVPGYWRNPDATSETIVDGWLRTGDLARLDDDGFCEIVDRAKDMINRGGENVYCLEVENVLANHPDVFEAAVVGVPDEVMGERVGMVLVPRPGGRVDPEQVAAFVAERLADFKVPEYLAVRDEPLPRNPGGKVLKPVLREVTDWHRRATAPRSSSNGQSERTPTRAWHRR